MKTKKKQQNYLILPIKHRESLLPLIILNDPINPQPHNLTLLYAKFRASHEQLYQGLKITIRNIRYLLEYYQNNTPKTQAQKRTFIEEFFKYFLKEEPIPHNQKLKAIPSIKDYILWVIAHKEVTNKEEKEFTQTLEESLSFSKKLPKSLFFTETKNQFYMNKEQEEKVVKAFPINKVIKLINKAPSIQMKIFYILLTFGGIKPSVALHLFTNDFQQIDNRLKVIIGDPEKSLIQNKTRTEFLKEYNLLPRTRTADLNQLVGWKRPRYQFPEKYESEIIFVGHVENYLMELHQEYIKWRNQFTDNPYYFLKYDGTPLGMRAVLKKFEKDCKKVGLKQGQGDGTNFTGLRYFYCYYTARVLKLDKVIIQRLLGFNKKLFVDRFFVDKNMDYLEINQIQGEDNVRRIS